MRHCYYKDHAVEEKDFYKDASKPDGLMNRCKSCDNEYRALKKARIEVPKKGARVLVLDIETSPNTVYTFQLWNANITPEKIIEPVRVLCFAASWLGSEEIRYYSEFHDGAEYMVEKMWELLEEADAVISYNGISFDEKLIRSEFLKHGLPPTAPWVSIDLLRAVRKTFKFPSNRLTYITEALDIGKKVEHSGFQLWIDCLNEDADAWEKMKEYNIGDITLTKELYYTLLPWMDTKLNAAHFEYSDHSPTCSGCGSDDLTLLSKPYRTAVSEFDQFRCNDCGKISRSRKRKEKLPNGCPAQRLD